MNAEDTVSISGSGKSLGEGNGKLTPVFLPGNVMDRGVQQASVHWVAKESDTI